jgi:hypothetical protein
VLLTIANKTPYNISTPIGVLKPESVKSSEISLAKFEGINELNALVQRGYISYSLYSAPDDPVIREYVDSAIESARITADPNSYIFNIACDSHIIIGQLVKIVDGIAIQSSSLDLNSLPAIGVVISKPTDTTCTIQTTGIINNLYNNLTPGSVYLVGPNWIPVLPPQIGMVGQIVCAQQIGIAPTNNTRLLLNKYNVCRYEII